MASFFGVLKVHTATTTATKRARKKENIVGVSPSVTLAGHQPHHWMYFMCYCINYYYFISQLLL